MRIQKFNDLEKFSNEDLNEAQRGIHKSLYDGILYPFFQEEDGFVGGSFLVTRDDATTVSVRAGTGFMYDDSATDPDPKYKMMRLAEDEDIDISAADADNDRYDIIVVKPAEEATGVAMRDVRQSPGGPIENTEVEKVVEATCEFDVVEGEPGADPQVPETPEGWIKIAEVLVTAATGIANSADVVDTRNQLVFQSDLVDEYDAYVSPSGDGSHTSLTAALADLSSGGSILIMEDLEIDSEIVVPANALISGRTPATVIDIQSGGKITFSGDNSKLQNITIETALTNANPLVEVDGDNVSFEKVLFDVPASESNLCIKVDGEGFDLSECIFLNCDGDGTDSNQSLTLAAGEVPSSKVIGSLQSKYSDVIDVDDEFTLLHAHSGKTIHVYEYEGDETQAYDLILPSPKKGWSVTIKDCRTSKNPALGWVILNRSAGGNIEGVDSNMLLNPDGATFRIWSDGTDFFLNRVSIQNFSPELRKFLAANFYANWVSIPITEETNSAWTALAASSTWIVAVAVLTNEGSKRVMRATVSSPDFWTAVDSPEDNNWQSIAFGNDVFVAVSGNGSNRTMRSTNAGGNWSAVAAAEANFWEDVAFGNDVFVAVASTGTNRTMRSTNDGTSWTGVAAANASLWRYVSFGNGVFLATSPSDDPGQNLMRSEDDGESWSLVNNAPEGISEPVWVAELNKWFVAAGDGLYESEDNGDTWTKISDNIPVKVIYGNGVLFGFNNIGHCCISTDGGASWIEFDFDMTARDVIFAGGYFVGVGTVGGGSIERSMRILPGLVGS